MKHILKVKTQRSEAEKNRQLILFCLSSGVYFLLSAIGLLPSSPCYAQTKDSDLLVDDSSFEYYKIIEQRNFFRPKKDIRESELELKSKKENKESEKDSLDFILTGVIEIKSGYKAIVEQKSSKKGFYVAVNEAIAGYTVKEIMLNKIIIEKDGKEFELKLQQGSKKNAQDNSSEPVNTIDTNETIDIDNNISSPKTLRENTIQQIRSGTRGTR